MLTAFKRDEKYNKMNLVNYLSLNYDCFIFNVSKISMNYMHLFRKRLKINYK